MLWEVKFEPVDQVTKRILISKKIVVGDGELSASNLVRTLNLTLGYPCP